MERLDSSRCQERIRALLEPESLRPEQQVWQLELWVLQQALPQGLPESQELLGPQRSVPSWLVLEPQLASERQQVLPQEWLAWCPLLGR